MRLGRRQALKNVWWLEREEQESQASLLLGLMGLLVYMLAFGTHWGRNDWPRVCSSSLGWCHRVFFFFFFMDLSVRRTSDICWMVLQWPFASSSSALWCPPFSCSVPSCSQSHLATPYSPPLQAFLAPLGSCFPKSWLVVMSSVLRHWGEITGTFTFSSTLLKRQCLKNRASLTVTWIAPSKGKIFSQLRRRQCPFGEHWLKLSIANCHC